MYLKFPLPQDNTKQCAVQGSDLLFVVIKQENKGSVRMDRDIQLGPPITRQQILLVFQSHGYLPNSMITKDKMSHVFNTEFTKRKSSTLNRDFVEEIWNESETTTKGEISVNTVADIVMDAQKILRDRVERLSGQKGMIKNLRSNIEVKNEEVVEFAKYYGEDREQLNNMTKQLMNMQIELNQNQADLKAFTEDLQSIGGIFSIDRPRQMTQYTLPPKEVPTRLQKSNRLLTMFHITNALVFLEFLIMGNQRVSMLTLTSLLHSYYLVLFGFANVASFTYILLHLLLTVVADTAFCIIHFLNKYEIMPIKHTDNNIYAFVLLIFLIGSIGLRVFLSVLFATMRASHSSKSIPYFTLMELTFPPKLVASQPDYGFYSQISQKPGMEQTQILNNGEAFSSAIGLPNDASHVQQYQLEEEFGESPMRHNFLANEHVELQPINMMKDPYQ